MAPELYAYRNGLTKPSAQDDVLSDTRVVIQPTLSVRGWPCNAGSKALEGYIALQNATAVDRLIQAGALIVGSSKISELGFGLAGDTTAQILTQSEADLALVMDTLGEARIAAAAARLFGFKPSFGSVSRFGLNTLVPSMASYGMIARSPATICKVLERLVGEDEDDPSLDDQCAHAFTKERPQFGEMNTVGIITQCLELLDAKERRGFETVLAQLADAGFTVKEMNLPDFNLFCTIHHVIAAVEASSSAGKYDGVRYGHRSAEGNNWNDMYLNTRGESFGTLIKTFLFQGAYFQFENYDAFENACRIRRSLVMETADVLGEVDVLASPTRRIGQDPFLASTINEIYGAFSLTLPANVGGFPSLQVPNPALNSNTDIGLQLTGLRFDDFRLLSLGMKLSSLQSGGQHEI